MITVVGVGAEGWESLSPEARAAVLAADLLVGGERQLGLVAGRTRAERRSWPPDLTTLVDELPALEDEGRTIVVLASGDPLLHGVGVTIVRRLGDERELALTADEQVRAQHGLPRLRAEARPAVRADADDGDHRASENASASSS